MIAIDGLLAGREVGPSDREQLRTVLRDLLAEGPSRPSRQTIGR